MKVTTSSRPSGSTTALMSSLVLRFWVRQIPRLGCWRASISRSVKARRADSISCSLQPPGSA
jgi:hypothetical protein